MIYIIQRLLNIPPASTTMHFVLLLILCVYSCVNDVNKKVGLPLTRVNLISSLNLSKSNTYTRPVKPY